MKRIQLSRRTVLRGLGVTMALPALEIMEPRRAYAQSTALRFLVCYAPNGFLMPKWKPTATGTTWTTPPLLAKLEPYRQDFSMISGLGSYPASIATKFGGSHTRACAAMLTQKPVGVSPTSPMNGISLDQIIANSLGNKTRFPSLQVGGRASTGGGNCEDQFSCAYNTNLSWSGPTTFVPKQVDPLDVFNRLFKDFTPPTPGQPTAPDNRALYQKSILDVVHARATALNKLLGKSDQQKVSQYFTSVREVEQRIANSIGQPGTPVGKCTIGAPPKNGANDADLPFPERLDLLSDLVALAFQCDVTRVATYMYEHAFSDQRSFSGFLPGVARRHHALSHLNNAAALVELEKIQLFYIDRFAYLMGKLKGMKEGTGTVLDNSIIYFTSEFGDGFSHNMRDLPMVLAGKGGGKLKTGLHVNFPLDPGKGTGADGLGNPNDTQLAALHLSILQCFGLSMPSFGTDDKGTPIATKPITEILV